MDRKTIYLLLLGFLVGFLSSFLGIGGGPMLVPILVIIFKYDIKKAVGTSLSVIPLLTLTGLIANMIINIANIMFLEAFFMILGSLIGLKVGIYFIRKISARALRIVLAIFLAAVGLKQIIYHGQVNNVALMSGGYIFLLIPGFIAGIASSFLGIGGGVVIVPALNVFFGFSMHQAIATSLFYITFSAFIGSLLHLREGNVEISSVKAMILPAMLGAVTGASLSSITGDMHLKSIFGVFMLIIAVRMIAFKSKQASAE